MRAFDCITARINYGPDKKFKTPKEVLDFLDDCWSAASHFDVFEERDQLQKEVENLKKQLEESK